MLDRFPIDHVNKYFFLKIKRGVFTCAILICGVTSVNFAESHELKLSIVPVTSKNVAGMSEVLLYNPSTACLEELRVNGSAGEGLVCNESINNGSAIEFTNFEYVQSWADANSTDMFWMRTSFDMIELEDSYGGCDINGCAPAFRAGQRSGSGTMDTPFRFVAQ